MATVKNIIDQQRWHVVNQIDPSYLPLLDSVELEYEAASYHKTAVLTFHKDNKVARVRYSRLDQAQCPTAASFTEMVRCRLAWALYQAVYLNG